jgi:hypothetical protein
MAQENMEGLVQSIMQHHLKNKEKRKKNEIVKEALKGAQQNPQWLRDYCDDLPKCVPVDFVIEALAEIMRSNIFQFGDTYWKQTWGCVMGTSAVVNYNNLYVGLLEVQRLLPCYETCPRSSNWLCHPTTASLGMHSSVSASGGPCAGPAMATSTASSFWTSGCRSAQTTT